MATPKHPFRYLEGIAALPSLASAQTPRAARVLAFLLVGFFLSAVVALFFTPWVQTSFGEGRVIAYAPLERQQPVEAPIEGRVQQWHVREGTHVNAGDPIVELSDNDPEILTRLRAERDAVQARIVAARLRIDFLTRRAADLEGSRAAAVAAASQRVLMARNRVRAAEQALTAAQAAFATARLQRDRQRELSRQGLSSTRTAEVAQLHYARTETEVARAQAGLAAARSEESALRSDSVRAGTDFSASIDDARASRAAAESELANGQAELTRVDVRLARQSTMRVTAPRAGTILRLVANQGSEMVRAGEPLAILVPDTNDRAVELLVDGNDVPLIQEGRHVRLQFEGWPALQFSGWPSVSVGSFGGRVAIVDAADNGRGKFRVVVVPDGPDPWPSGRFLRQGVRANGWVLLGTVSLGYELWRQFNGFPATYAIEEASRPGGSGTSSRGRN